MPIKKMQDLDLTGKTVVIREDLNVPMKEGEITNDKRIRASLPTIRTALEKGAGVVLLSHLGRPTEGQYDEQFSLKPVAARLTELLETPVRLAATPEEAKAAPGEVTLLENVRFLKGEKKNDPALAAQLAGLGDVYVMDAFGAAHRAHASTEGAVRAANVACAGPLLQAELEAFSKVLDNPARPLAAIIGGSKVSTKLALLENLLEKVDMLIVGGGIANTFLAASGYMVGKSLYEEELVPDAKRIMEQAKTLNRDLPLPVDVVTAEELAPGQTATTRAVGDVPADQMILDIGRETIQQYKSCCQRPPPWCGTGLWARSRRTPSDRAPRNWRSILPNPTPLWWWAAVIPWLRWKSTVFPKRWATFPPAAARRWNCLKAKLCRL